MAYNEDVDLKTFGSMRLSRQRCKCVFQVQAFMLRTTYIWMIRVIDCVLRNYI